MTLEYSISCNIPCIPRNWRVCVSSARGPLINDFWDEALSWVWCSTRKSIYHNMNGENKFWASDAHRSFVSKERSPFITRLIEPHPLVLNAGMIYHGSKQLQYGYYLVNHNVWDSERKARDVEPPMLEYADLTILDLSPLCWENQRKSMRCWTWDGTAEG